MSDTPRTDAAFARCVEEGGPHEPFHGPLIKESEALERELAQAQARCAELNGLLREVYGEFAKRHIHATDFQRRIDAALKETR